MDRATLSRLRRQHNYPAFYTAATAARLADEMFSVGIVLLVLERTGSAVLAGATVAAITFPSFVSGPLLGAWLDLTGRRRRLMVFDQLLITATLVALVLLVGETPGWVLPLVVLAAGLTYPLSFAGFTSLVPAIVDEDLLPHANALEASSFNIAIIGGPALAGAISALAGPQTSLLVEAGLSLAVVPLLLRLAALEGGKRKVRASAVLSTTRAGIRHMLSIPALRGVTVTGAMQLGGLGFLVVAFPFMAEDLGADRSAAGFLWAAFAAGSMAGALSSSQLHDRWRPERLVFGGIAGLGVLMLLWPLATSLPMAIGLVTLAALADGPAFAATFTVRQRWTPRELFGQVVATAASLKVGAFSLGAALGGPTVTAIGARGTLVLVAGIQLSAALAGLLAMRGRGARTSRGAEEFSSST